MNRSISIVPACLIVLCGCARTPTTDSSATLGARSTGQDTYNRLLEVQVSDFAGTYQVGAPIPVTVRISNLGPQESRDADVPSKHPTAQLFPHLTVWIEQNSKVRSEQMALPIENRIRIKQTETFERQVDLSKAKILSTPGEYEVSIGHENGFISDLGDWTGTLRSRAQTIVTKKKE
jgi:hypothetical protein